MTEREQSNSIVLPLKRKRGSSFENYDQNEWHYKSLGKKAFKAEMHQSGKSKALWYFSSLYTEIISAKSIIYSDWFTTGDTEKWRLVLWPNKKSSSTGLYVELHLNNLQISYKRSANINFKLLTAKSSKFETTVDFNFSETFKLSRVDWGNDTFINHSKYLKLLIPSLSLLMVKKID